jgi:hypothetical protein
MTRRFFREAISPKRFPLMLPLFALLSFAGCGEKPGGSPSLPSFLISTTDPEDRETAQEFLRFLSDPRFSLDHPQPCINKDLFHFFFLFRYLPSR